MKHRNTLRAEATAVLVVDMQEGFREVIADFEEVANQIARLVRAVDMLDVPIVWCEQYPKGLGRTAPSIQEALGESRHPIEKKCFSGCGLPDVELALRGSGARSVLVCGIEAHICVSQSVHDLLALGFQVHVVEDAVTSRRPLDREIGLRKMAGSGAVPCTVEMAVFEMLQTADHPSFREIQKLFKT